MGWAWSLEQEYVAYEKGQPWSDPRVSQGDKPRAGNGAQDLGTKQRGEQLYIKEPGGCSLAWL